MTCIVFRTGDLAVDFNESHLIQACTLRKKEASLKLSSRCRKEDTILLRSRRTTGSPSGGGRDKGTSVGSGAVGS